MNELFIDMKLREKRFAVRQNGELVRLYIDQPNERSEIGYIYVGTVESISKSINAAFVNLGKNKNGYLHLSEIPAYLHAKDKNNHDSISHFIHEGEKILVQIKKDETGTKGPLLSGILEFPGDKTVYLPEGKYIAISKQATANQRNEWINIVKKYKDPHEGFIVRTEALQGTEEEWLEEIKVLRHQYIQLKQKMAQIKSPALLQKKVLIVDEILRELLRLKTGVVYCNDLSFIEQIKTSLANKAEVQWQIKHENARENIFSIQRLEQEVDAVHKKKIWLENGAYIVIDETEAATIIDVNTGKFTKKNQKRETIMQTNRMAAIEIARQLKIRDYGGIILIDFIDMPTTHERNEIHTIFEKALKQDIKHIHLSGFTPLGIFELTRKRTRQSLPESLQVDCQVCHGTGKVLSPETVAYRLERELFELKTDEEAVLIECDEKTKQAFTGEADQYRRKLEQFLRLKIYIKVIDSMKATYAIRRFGTAEDLRHL